MTILADYALFVRPVAEWALKWAGEGCIGGPGSTDVEGNYSWAGFETYRRA
jgi:hypothetical protein